MTARGTYKALSLLLVLACAACADAPSSSDGGAGVRGDISGCPTEGAPHPPIADSTGRVVRHGPVIVNAMLPGRDGRNISGPSPIETPDWLPDRLGRYYLYFASHVAPRHIRLAYADNPSGPWRMADRPVTIAHPDPAATSVLAPEAVVDHDRRAIRLYLAMHFRSDDPRKRRAGTYAATSTNGRTFAVASGLLGPAYSRVLSHEGATYLFLGASGQRVYRSADGISAFEPGPMVLPRRDEVGAPYSRHIALQPAGHTLRVFFTRKRDAPERVLLGTIDVTDDWRRWRVTGADEILRPSLPYEGVHLPVIPSREGPAAPGGEHALRDPAVLESDGRTWLFYTLAGECGIGVAELLL